MHPCLLKTEVFFQRFRKGVGRRRRLARGDPSYARDSDLFFVPFFPCLRCQFPCGAFLTLDPVHREPQPDLYSCEPAHPTRVSRARARNAEKVSKMSARVVWEVSGKCLESVFGLFPDFFGDFLGVPGRRPRETFSRLFRQFGPGGPDSERPL